MKFSNLKEKIKEISERNFLLLILIFYVAALVLVSVIAEIIIPLLPEVTKIIVGKSLSLFSLILISLVILSILMNYRTEIYRTYSHFFSGNPEVIQQLKENGLSHLIKRYRILSTIFLTAVPTTLIFFLGPLLYIDITFLFSDLTFENSEVIMHMGEIKIVSLIENGIYSLCLAFTLSFSIILFISFFLLCKIGETLESKKEETQKEIEIK
jgi:hypothetical protein